MSFTDFIFFPFAALTVLAYFCIPLQYRWVVLLASSLMFYCTWGLEKMPFLLAASLTAYLAGRQIQRIYAKADKQAAGLAARERAAHSASAKRRARVWLWLGVAVLLGMLAYVKLGRLVANGLGGKLPLIVPLGISFYTLSLLGYIADVYWRKEPAEWNFFRMLLFTAYFPKILQGPISKYRSLAGQLVEGHRFDWDRLCFGVQLMVWGYFKKLVIADRLAILTGQVFGSYPDYSGSVLLLAAMGSTVQLYCDFSGCVDIASGFSQILGIELEKNFDHPFHAESAAEYWRRWHMSLGAWFKDYIYLPLAVSPRVLRLAQKVKHRFGSRAGKAVPTMIALAAVWTATGFWHGTGANYIIWGFFWGGLIILTNVFAPELQRLDAAVGIQTDECGWRLFCRFRTFALLTFTKFITLPGDLAATGAILGSVFTDFQPWKLTDGTLLSLGLNAANLNLAVLCLILLGLIEWGQQRGSVRKWIAGRVLPVRWAIYYAAVFAVLIFGIYGPDYDANSFVYMNF